MYTGQRRKTAKLPVLKYEMHRTPQISTVLKGVKDVREKAREWG